MVSEPLLSASRSRRLRGAATKRRLYEQTLKAENVTNPNMLHAMDNEKVEALTILIQQLSCDLATTIAWLTQYCYPQFIGTEWVSSYDYQGVGQDVHSVSAEGACSNEATLSDPSCKLWKPAPKNTFAPYGSATLSELRVEAAQILQRFYRSSFKSRDDDSSIASVCAYCGEAFGPSQLHDSFADRCDECGEYVHSYCLQSAKDFEDKNWEVCHACLENHRQKFHQSCERRETTSTQSERDIQNDENIFSAQVQCEQGHGPQPTTSTEVDAELTILDSRLDYMLKYLEIGKGRLRQDVHDIVLQLVKDTLVWKAESRTVDEIICKVRALDDSMSTIVKET